MLATMVEHVIGIDPDRDRITASVVDTATTGEQASAVFATTRSGYDQLLVWAQPAHTSPAGVGGRGHRQLWCRRGQLPHFPRRTGGGIQQPPPEPATAPRPTHWTPAAPPAKCSAAPWPSVPRARGDREALRVLETTRQSAQNARVTAINALKALVITAPHRPQRPTPGSEHHSVGHQNQQVPVGSQLWKRTGCYQTSHAFSSPTDQDPHHRNSRTENIHHRPGRHRRSSTTPATRRRTNHRRTGVHRLVPPPPLPHRSRFRSSSRGSTPRSLLRTKHPSPTKPLRRPNPQPCALHHRYHPHPDLSQNPRLHSQTHQPRKNHPRSPPLPQTIHRPPPLPTPRKPTTNGRNQPKHPCRDPRNTLHKQPNQPPRKHDFEYIEAS